MHSKTSIPDVKKIIYNEKQKSELKKNKYVKNCTDFHIVFLPEFKKKSVELFKTWIEAKDVFKQLGFPDYVYNSKVPGNSIGRWIYQLKIRWTLEWIKWRPKKVKN